MLTEDQTISNETMNKATTLALKHKTVDTIDNKEKIVENITKDIKNGVYKHFQKLEKELKQIIEKFSKTNNEVNFNDFLTLVGNEYI